jgi:hypothetical protein
MSDDIKYEYKSVQAVRGMENRAIAKEQKEGGWELVDQTPATLRTTLNFRRIKPATFLSKAWAAVRSLTPAKQLALAAAAAVVLLIAAVGVTIAAAHDKGDTNTENLAAKPTDPATTNETLTPSPTPTPTEEIDQVEVITAENSEEFAALLKTGDYCDPSIARFAAQYEGQQIEFNGSIADVQPYENYDTRYSILLGPGNAGPNTGIGPAFKYENVNMSDLNLTGKNIPDYVAAGDRFRFSAEVDGFNPDQCLLFLTPVSTTAR